MNRITLATMTIRGGDRRHYVCLGGEELFVFTTFREALEFIYNIRGL